MNSVTHIRPVYATRWQNFRALLAKHELTITRAAELLGKTQGQVSHFGGKDPSKVIGDQLAGEIETAFGLESGSLDLNTSEGKGSVNEPNSNSEILRIASQIQELTAPILAQAEHWVRFEEEAIRRWGKKPWGDDPVSQPLRRAERLLSLTQRLLAHGGVLPPEEAAEIIDAVRRQGETPDGRKTRRGDA